VTTPSPIPPIPAVHPSSGTVFDIIAAWARRATRRRLATWAIGGALDAAGIVAVRPGWWLAAAPFACIAAVGVWGLAAREASATVPGAEPPPAWRRRGLTVVRIAAVAVGTAAAVASFYGALWLVFGTRWGPSGG